MRQRVKVDVSGPLYRRVLSALGLAVRQAGHLAGEAAAALRADADAPERVYHRLSILGRPPKQDLAPSKIEPVSKIEPSGEHLCQCDNCCQIFREEQLHVVENWWERFDDGGILPAGQCPECGSLAYWMKGTPSDEYKAYLKGPLDPRD